MSIQIVKLYHKDQQYTARETELEQQLTQEQKRQEQIAEHEEYIGSKEYIEDTAKSKLGLVYENETIFKEK